MLILNVLKVLNRFKVRYLVIGGVAGAFYGDPRFTKDLDIFADEEEENLRKLVGAFKKLGFITRIPVKPEEFLSRATIPRILWRMWMFLWKPPCLSQAPLKIKNISVSEMSGFQWFRERI